MSRIGDCSAGIGANIGEEDVGEMELPTLESLDLRAAGCLAFPPSVMGTRLMSRIGDCSTGIGAAIGEKDVNAVVRVEVLKAEVVEATGLEL
jgi:hypothetical protein